tara:strand:+ start:522 stop:623 length:102 start_codon:yes stop_codon:yes gene_type:complete
MLFFFLPNCFILYWQDSDIFFSFGFVENISWIW